MDKSDLNERFAPARPKLDLPKDEKGMPRQCSIPLSLIKLLPFTDDKNKMLRFEA